MNFKIKSKEGVLLLITIIYFISILLVIFLKNNYTITFFILMGVLLICDSLYVKIKQGKEWKKQVEENK